MTAAPLNAAPPRAAGLLVVGSGVAGLYAALTAAARGLEVTLLTKDNLENSNSWFAQGGLSAVGPDGISRGDSVASHVADTLTAGARLNDAAAVAAMCGAAWDHVERLTEAGAVFDSDPEGGYALGLEAAHAHARILHAGGDATGKALAGALIDACLKQEAAGALRIRERAFVTELLARGPLRPRTHHRRPRAQRRRHHRGAHRRRGAAGHRGHRQPVRCDHQPARRHRRRRSAGLPRRRPAGGQRVRPVPPHAREPRRLHGLRGRARRGGDPRRPTRAPLHARCPPGRRACPARRGRPRHPRGQRRGRAGLPGRHGRGERSRARLPGPALPLHHRRPGQARPRPGRRAGAGHRGRPLLDGRRLHRPARAHHPAGSLRRGGDRLHRRARRQPAGLQLPAGGAGLRLVRGGQPAGCRRNRGSTKCGHRNASPSTRLATEP